MEVLQPRLNAMQDAAADRAQPLQSLRKGVHQALCPVEEESRWRQGTYTCPLCTSLTSPESLLIISRVVR